jgi:putative DNA primase/helicase
MAPAQIAEIDAGDLELQRVSDAAWAALKSWNSPPFLFRSGSVAMRLEPDDNGNPGLRELVNDKMRHVLARAASWYRIVMNERKPALPPMHVVKDMLASSDLPLPVLNRIVEAPVFSPSGELQTEPGYHIGSRTYFAPKEGFEVPEVPMVPTTTDIAKARMVILDELLADFPFVGDAERAHAMSCMLLPYARDLIPGATPLHLIEAPSPGTGKGLLIEVLTYPALGRSVTTMTEGRDEDEWRKRITSKLMIRPSVLLVDNLRRRLDSAAVAAAVTSPAWEDRILGQSKIVNLPVRCLWVATGNNPALSNEMARRTLRIRLDAKVDRPWLRREFRHRNLRSWAVEHRAELVWSALLLIQAWLAEGRPMYSEKTLGMFEEWTGVMGGILSVAGIPGFLGNLDDFYEASNEEASLWRGFVQAWLERYGENEVGVSELFDLNNELDEPLDLGKGEEKSRRTKLGKELVQARDRQYEDVRISLVGERHRAKRWRLIRVGANEPVNIGELFPADKMRAGSPDSIPFGEESLELGSPSSQGSPNLDLEEIEDI